MEHMLGYNAAQAALTKH